MVPFTLRLLWAELPVLVANDPTVSPCISASVTYLSILSFQQGKKVQDDRGTAAYKETMSRLHSLHTMAKRVLKSRGILRDGLTMRCRHMLLILQRPAGPLPDDGGEDKYSCMSTLDAVSRIEDTTEAWMNWRIRTVMALVGRYVAKQNFAVAVQLLHKVSIHPEALQLCFTLDLFCRKSRQQDHAVNCWQQT
jgi:hypothetical protein